MRSLVVRLVALMIVASLASACWADFPDSRFGGGDGWIESDAGGVDWFSPADGPVGKVDKGLAVDQAVVNCKPDEFLGCNSNKAFQRCNKAGDAILTIDCKTAACDAKEKRCDECKPGAAPACAASELRTCSDDGLFENTKCQHGCQADACCKDDDQDTFSCNDCNDKKKDVFPGQQKFFDKEADGSYDYDCDKTEEPEFPAVVSCPPQGKCEGGGWVGTIPACGKEGQFSNCVKITGNCQPEAPKKKKQRCR